MSRLAESAQALSGVITDANGITLSDALKDLIGTDDYENKMTDAPGIGGRQDAIEGVIHQYRKDIADAVKAAEQAYFSAHVQHMGQ